MKPKDIRLGQLLKTEHGLATVMKFFAPACIGCIVVSKKKASLINYPKLVNGFI